MRLGQIPVNNHYREFFDRAGHGIQITDDNGTPVFVSGEAQPLTADIWERIKRESTPVYKDENTLLFKEKITGGYAVWQEDVTAINKLRGELEATNREIEMANQTLSHTVHTKEHAAQAKARAELYAALEKIPQATSGGWRKCSAACLLRSHCVPFTWGSRRCLYAVSNVVANY